MDTYRTCLEERLLSLVEEYAEITGTTTEACIAEAVEDWLNTTAAAVMENRLRHHLAKTA